MKKNYLIPLKVIRITTLLVLSLITLTTIQAQTCSAGTQFTSTALDFPGGSSAANLTLATTVNGDDQITQINLTDDLSNTVNFGQFARWAYSNGSFPVPLHIEFDLDGIGSCDPGILVGFLEDGVTPTTAFGGVTNQTVDHDFMRIDANGAPGFQAFPGGQFGYGASDNTKYEIDVNSDGDVTYTIDGTVVGTVTGGLNSGKNYRIGFGSRPSSGCFNNTPQTRVLSNVVISELVCVSTPPIPAVIVDLDGDGIDDKDDLDDDNDGILDSDEAGACASFGAPTATLEFINEDFGTGTTKSQMSGSSSTTYTYDAGANNVDGTTTPNEHLVDGEYALVHLLHDNGATHTTTFTGSEWANPHNDMAVWAELAWTADGDHTPGDTNGKMAVFNAANAAGRFFTQSINGVEPSTNLTVSFWARNIDQNEPAITHGGNRIKPDIRVQFTDLNGTELRSEDTGILQDESNGGGWTQYSYTITVAQLNGNTEVQFNLINNAAGGEGNDLAIDDIVVSQVLCDSDGDGTPNSRDLDDDGDGIPTVVEVGLGGIDTNNSANLLDSSTWADGNGDGVHDSYPAGKAVVNSDSDAIPDYLDLDSDNDGIFDIVEYDGFGDADVNGDGVGDLEDADGDGLVDFTNALSGSYDKDVTNYGAYDGSTGYLDPVDTAPTDTPDYRNPSSNNVDNDIDNTIFGALDADNDGEIDDTTDSDGDGLVNSFDSDDATAGSPRDYTTYELHIDFDGRNDYIEAPEFLNSLGATPTTMMAWIMIEGGTGRREIMGEGDNAGLFIHESGGNNYVGYVQNGATRLCTDIAIPSNVWVHVAVAIGWSGEVNVYVNGERDATVLANIGYPISAGENFNIGRKSDGTNYFNGAIDEVRVIRTSLTQDYIQAMVCQKLNRSGSSFIEGDVTGISTTVGWTGLAAYYRMDGFQDDVVDDYTTDGVIDITGARAYNIHNIQFETTPLPYQTSDYSGIGDWKIWHYGGSDDIWLHDDVWDIKNVNHYSEADIVEVRDNIYLQRDHTLYGLIINTSKMVVQGFYGATPPGYGLTVTGYLKFESGGVNGVLDLWGESQLIQTEGSVFDPTSVGGFEVNQEAISNSYAYNYLCLPTSNSLSQPTPNADVSINEALRTADNTYNPLLVNWCNGADCTDNGTLSISSRWLYTFPPNAPIYANWVRINQNTSLSFGNGFTMKGVYNSGNIDMSAGRQFYTFVGFPNNAASNIIVDNVGGGEFFLTGNPFPSALDANDFIAANSSSITGALYFWEHWSNNTHILKDYQGGYATYNLSGSNAGAQATSNPDIAPGGTARMTPRRYVPLGQGFVVYGDADGGDIVFNNNQREFVLENDAVGGSNFIRGEKDHSITEEQNLPSRIRLGLRTGKIERPILIAFIDGATEDLDYGYEAEVKFEYNSDSYMIQQGKKLSTQGFGELDKDLEIPLMVVVDKKDGEVIQGFKINNLENIPADTELYIKDQLTGLYHNLRTGDFNTTLQPGKYKDRFSLVFNREESGKGTLSNEEVLEEQIAVYVNNNNSSITIDNGSNIILEGVSIFSSSGQLIQTWSKDSLKGTKIELPINLSNGVYLVNTNTTEGTISTKVLVK